MDIKKILHKGHESTTRLTCEFILNMWKTQHDGVYTHAEVTAELERYQRYAMQNIEKQKP